MMKSEKDFCPVLYVEWVKVARLCHRKKATLADR